MVNQHLDNTQANQHLVVTLANHQHLEVTLANLVLTLVKVTLDNLEHLEVTLDNPVLLFLMDTNDHNKTIQPVMIVVNHLFLHKD